MRKIIVNPSIKAAKTFNYEDLMQKLIKNNFKHFHVDIMDVTATNSFGVDPGLLTKFNQENIQIDFHIMSNNAINLIKTFPKLKNKPYAYTHYKMVENYNYFVEQCLKYDIQPGISIDLDLDLNLIKNFIRKIKYVNFMSVNQLGLENQIFDEKVFEKIKEFKKLYGNNFIFSIDGSVRENHLNQIYGLFDIVVVGSLIFKHQDWNKARNDIENNLT